jgi:hypothetical protein
VSGSGIGYTKSVSLLPGATTTALFQSNTEDESNTEDVFSEGRGGLACRVACGSWGAVSVRLSPEFTPSSYRALSCSL